MQTLRSQQRRQNLGGGWRNTTHAQHYERLKRIVDAAKSLPCEGCGNTWPAEVMRCIHRPGETVLFKVAEYRTLLPGEDVLRAELDKCAVMCANCAAMSGQQRARR